MNELELELLRRIIGLYDRIEKLEKNLSEKTEDAELWFGKYLERDNELTKLKEELKNVERDSD